MKIPPNLSHEEHNSILGSETARLGLPVHAHARHSGLRLFTGIPSRKSLTDKQPTQRTPTGNKPHIRVRAVVRLPRGGYPCDLPKSKAKSSVLSNHDESRHRVLPCRSCYTVTFLMKPAAGGETVRAYNYSNPQNPKLRRRAPELSPCHVMTRGTGPADLSPS